MAGTWPTKGFGPLRAVLFGHPSTGNRDGTHVVGRMVRAMRHTAVIAALGLFVLTGCGSQPTAPSDIQTSAPAKSPGAAKAGEPTTAQRRTYLRALEKIDPGLVVNEERAVRRGRAVCDRMLNGMDGSKNSLTSYVVQELSGGNATINEDQAAQVIQLVAAWCKPA